MDGQFNAPVLGLLSGIQGLGQGYQAGYQSAAQMAYQRMQMQMLNNYHMGMVNNGAQRANTQSQYDLGYGTNGQPVQPLGAAPDGTPQFGGKLGQGDQRLALGARGLDIRYMNGQDGIFNNIATHGDFYAANPEYATALRGLDPGGPGRPAGLMSPGGLLPSGGPAPAGGPSPSGSPAQGADPGAPPPRPVSLPPINLTDAQKVGNAKTAAQIGQITSDTGLNNVKSSTDALKMLQSAAPADQARLATMFNQQFPGANLPVPGTQVPPKTLRPASTAPAMSSSLAGGLQAMGGALGLPMLGALGQTQGGLGVTTPAKVQPGYTVPAYAPNVDMAAQIGNLTARTALTNTDRTLAPIKVQNQADFQNGLLHNSGVRNQIYDQAVNQSGAYQTGELALGAVRNGIAQQNADKAARAGGGAAGGSGYGPQYDAITRQRNDIAKQLMAAQTQMTSLSMPSAATGGVSPRGAIPQAGQQYAALQARVSQLQAQDKDLNQRQFTAKEQFQRGGGASPTGFQSGLGGSPAGLAVAQMADKLSKNISPNAQDCEVRVRHAFQSVSPAYNKYFGGSAKETAANFQRGGIGQPYHGQSVPPGSALYAPQMGQWGHAAIMGADGKTRDQYGVGHFPLSTFRYVVPPPGGASGQGAAPQAAAAAQSRHPVTQQFTSPTAARSRLMGVLGRR